MNSIGPNAYAGYRELKLRLIPPEGGTESRSELGIRRGWGGSTPRHPGIGMLPPGLPGGSGRALQEEAA